MALTDEVPVRPSVNFKASAPQSLGCTQVMIRHPLAMHKQTVRQAVQQ